MLSVGVIAVPSFVVALLLLLVFAVSLRWFPAIGVGEAGNAWDPTRHLVLPSIAIGLGWVGYLARLVRASMLEVLGVRPHAAGLRAPRANGRVPVRAPSRDHADDRAPRDRGGAISCPGRCSPRSSSRGPASGSPIFDAVLARNYPVVMGAVLVTTAVFVLCTLLADIVAAWCDPPCLSSL